MGVSPIIIGVLGAVLIIARALHALGLMGNAESFNRATGIVINWATLGLASIIGIVEFFFPGTL
jgi:uncharacterized membrane protein YecN with MAPEG domain